TNDPLGNPVDEKHPWNKQTIPQPEPYGNWDKKYSWGISPRWVDWKKRADGKSHSLEAGAYSRFYVTAKSKMVPESTGDSIKFVLPKATIAGYRVSDETEFEWRIPDRVNAIERVRARAYYYAFSVYTMYLDVLKSLELVKSGNAKIWNKYSRPRNGIGVGMIDAMRGALSHWVVMKDHKIANYQIISPSTWNAGPRLGDDDLGPYEEAIKDTPLTEKYKEDELYGVDVVRVVRSFDPCLACCVHLYKGDEKIGYIPEI
ncbi:MAG: nickel-dependent hydrogenase large subunit, partial [Deltaproteobacteria bacterium]